MSNESSGHQDPLDFLKSMWNNMGFSLPGMVTPTLDVDELSKRIADLKAVESWLKMNLNMLQMTIQGLEMQRVALATIQAIGQSAQTQQAGSGANEAGSGNSFLDAALNTALNPAMNPALWPWNFMQPSADGSTGTVSPAAPETNPQKAGK